MNWKAYLEDKIYNEQAKVSKLLNIDNEENGTNYNVSLVLNLLEKDINFDIDKYDTIILEGNFFILINLIDKCINKTINIKVATLDDYALNSYIKAKYEEYCKDYNINENINIDINEVFKIDTKNVLSIGCKPFVRDMTRIFNSDSLEFEL